MCVCVGMYVCESVHMDVKVKKARGVSIKSTRSFGYSASVPMS